MFIHGLLFSSPLAVLLPFDKNVNVKFQIFECFVVADDPRIHKRFTLFNPLDVVSANHCYWFKCFKFLTKNKRSICEEKRSSSKSKITFLFYIAISR